MHAHHHKDEGPAGQVQPADLTPKVFAPDEALKAASKKAGRDIVEGDLKQDEDVMDTWFSSWIWPIQVFDGLHKEEEVAYYYPTNDLVTAPEIMFFWVARMTMIKMMNTMNYKSHT